MLDLTPLLGVALERNVSESALFHFKFNAHQMMAHIIEGLTVPLPMMTVEQGAALLTRVHGLVAGLWPMTKPNEVMAAVPQRLELGSLHSSLDGAFLCASEIFVLDILTNTLPQCKTAAKK